LVLVPVPPTGSAGTTLVVILCLLEEGVNLRPHPGHSITGDTLPDSQNIAFARDDDYFFGVLHSRANEPSAARDGNFAGGRSLLHTDDLLRNVPVQGTFGGASDRDVRGRPLEELLRNWLDSEVASEAELKKRTLTNPYNGRPTWLENAHA